MGPEPVFLVVPSRSRRSSRTANVRQQPALAIGSRARLVRVHEIGKMACDNLRPHATISRGRDEIGNLAGARLDMAFRANCTPNKYLKSRMPC
jgi:hypothetical protein